MGFFFIFTIFIILVVFLGIRHNAKVNEAWVYAAKELRFMFRKLDSGNRHIQGSRPGFTIVIETTYRNKARWTEFNLRFDERLPVSFELTKQHFLSGISRKLLNNQDIEVGDHGFDEQAVISGRNPEEVRAFLNRERRDSLKRLFGKFDGYKISSGGIKVEEHSLITDSAAIVRAVNLLSGVAKTLMETQREPGPIPPPLPRRKSPSELSLAEESVEEPAVPEEPPPVPSPVEMADHSEAESDPVEEESVVPEETVAVIEEEMEEPVFVQPSEISHAVTDFACDILDLFTLNQSHYEISNGFKKFFLNEKIESEIVPQRVEKYFLDRTFGRGPGILLRGEICRVEEGGAVSLVIAYPEEQEISELREMIGKTFPFSGTIIKCDTFSREIFVVADPDET